MRGRALSAALFLAAALSAAAQEPASRGDSYLIPQTIFVGDRGRLVVPLGQAFMGVEAFVRSSSPELPVSRDLAVSRIELEHRNGNARLLIDFIPYAPGPLPLPPIVVPASPEPLTVTGLEVSVASILAPQEAFLSDPASPLTVPGTGFIVYGAAAAFLVLLSTGIGGSLWGRKHFASFRERFRRRRLLRSMKRFLIRLRSESQREGKGQGELFSLLSGEFREFLSYFTQINCRVLTPGEFKGIRLSPAENLNGNYLCDLFSRWEIIRFSGSRIGRDDLLAVLDELRLYISELDRSEKAAS
ncbi:MAG: hypothetical protein LBS48_03660 [Treponema sp.]|jgi:hypothetical protein|nr:hypothetical protein [Treponema sp.]